LTWRRFTSGDHDESGGIDGANSLAWHSSRSGPEACGAGAPEDRIIHAAREQVVIETYDARRLQGSVSEARADSFILTNDGRSTTLTYAEVRRVFAPGQLSKPVTAILVGGVVAGVLLALVWALGGLRG
jgi:hypothetical protein